VEKKSHGRENDMFEELLETEPKAAQVKGRKVYFATSAAVMGIVLFSALIISLFAVDLDMGIGDMDAVELVAPVDVLPDIHPEMDQAPKQKQQAPGGSAQAPTRQTDMARVDETPQAVPTTISTSVNTALARPLGDNFNLGKSDIDSSGIGSGRGPGNGTGDGLGDGIGDGVGDGTEAKAEDSTPPPPVRKAPAPEKPIVMSLGVVNSRAMSLPVPIIPATARAVNVSGTVSVHILVDENGKVVSASAVSGNPLLRESSEIAARNAKFTPTLLSGKPVKISGVINYYFS
jgi:hypothetical protein